MTMDIISRHNQLNLEIRQLVKMKREALQAVNSKRAEVTALDVDLNALTHRRDMLLAEVDKAERLHKDVFKDTADSQLHVTYSTRMPKLLVKFLARHIYFASITKDGHTVEWSK